ncbi:small acid-soluble spore protein (thioredoxin-like protein) [Halobacillus karajensis]|uniref:Small, acid-soluble spore protein Tlp n=1 Tax=Halobacillus karajensis TaxID=195088 RepID=A0A024P1B9_9BACI|nr:Small, acid-soluble spore protein Tlp [Halobacillus karajensis]CDQ22084.1 Small, acid-soluble spore protein Tlp [Halobacillus karajensis]CDQ27925.1 Small, acid-soluble spore protein Tlp [Halobacillus karajensis]SEH79344.1 small acid-soluble spore protein (thioredoxin-like protein) [Halobacillus karajensis]
MSHKQQHMANQKPNPDNRADNVDRLQENVTNTIENIEASHEALQFASDEEKRNIEKKNKRRNQSLEAMRDEIKDEARHQQY